MITTLKWGGPPGLQPASWPALAPLRNRRRYRLMSRAGLVAVEAHRI